jgi:hypothetical protein
MSEGISVKAGLSNTKGKGKYDETTESYLGKLDPDEKEEFLKNLRALEERTKRTLERKEKRYKEDMEYLRRHFPSSIEGIIIKLESYDYDNPKLDIPALEYYERETGVDALSESTLILADDENSSYLIFIKEDGEVVTKHIGDSIHVLERYEYNRESTIRKRHEPTRIPKHLRPLIIINNTTINNTIVNNINGDNINGDVINVINKFDAIKVSEYDDIKDLFGRNYNQEVMYPIKEMKKHPCWRKEYRSMLEVKQVHMCNSCGTKSHKGCCPAYSPGNRTKIKMVIGWSKK